MTRESRRPFLDPDSRTIVALLPVINPLAAAPTFLAITEGDSPESRRRQLRRACFYMIGILVSFLIGGTFIMEFFGLSIPGLRIAGGLLVAVIGFDMLLGPPVARTLPDSRMSRPGPSPMCPFPLSPCRC